MGKAYRDVVRGFRGRYERTPDMVARPRDEDDVRRVLEVCADKRLAAIPFGGGTSVVGGVEPRVGHGYRGVVTIDLSALDRVLEVDEVSLAARVQAGVPGPALDKQLGEHGLTGALLSRSRSSTRRSAAGSRPAPAVTSRPFAPTSTTSSSRSGR